MPNINHAREIFGSRFDHGVPLLGDYQLLVRDVVSWLHAYGFPPGIPDKSGYERLDLALLMCMTAARAIDGLGTTEAERLRSHKLAVKLCSLAAARTVVRLMNVADELGFLWQLRMQSR